MLVVVSFNEAIRSVAGSACGVWTLEFGLHSFPTGTKHAFPVDASVARPSSNFNLDKTGFPKYALAQTLKNDRRNAFDELQQLVFTRFDFIYFLNFIFGPPRLEPQ